MPETYAPRNRDELLGYLAGTLRHVRTLNAGSTDCAKDNMEACVQRALVLYDEWQVARKSEVGK